MIFAGIGSRDTPRSVCKEMMNLGAWARAEGHTVYSGHADGADWAFESNAPKGDLSFATGAQENCVAFIPWKWFNRQLVSKAKLVVVEPTDYLREVVYKFHPAPKNLSSGAMKLMCRNTFQVLGGSTTEDFDRAKAVVCWTSDGKDSGGTGQAIRIAMAHGIPVLNMHSQSLNTADKIKAALQAMKG